ncbi:hypothetical protein ACWYXN_16195 [Janthinobacterium aestuarii]
MFKNFIDLLKTYFFRPLYGRVVLCLLGMAAPLLVISFGADIQFHTEGEAFGNTFSFSYKNGASFIPALLLFIALVSLAMWIFFKVGSPSLPRSVRISELEDAYGIKGGVDSVCVLFNEVHGVSVSSSELTNLMTQPETSTRARSLKNARSHVNFSSVNGFELKNPRYPYRFLRVFFTVVYFVSALLCQLLISLLVTAFMSSPSLAAQIFACMVLLAVVAWSSLKAYSACNSALSITGG